MRRAACTSTPSDGRRGREAVHPRLRVEADQLAERGHQVVLHRGASGALERKAVHHEIGVPQRRRARPHLVDDLAVARPVVRVVVGALGRRRRRRAGPQRRAARPPGRSCSAAAPDPIPGGAVRRRRPRSPRRAGAAVTDRRRHHRGPPHGGRDRAPHLRNRAHRRRPSDAAHRRWCTIPVNRLCATESRPGRCATPNGAQQSVSGESPPLSGPARHHQQRDVVAELARQAGAVGQREHVVPVAAHLVAVEPDEVARRQRHFVHLGKGGQQAVLQRDHCCVLGLVEPGVVDGETRPAREIGGQMHVARGVATAVGMLRVERRRAESASASARRSPSAGDRTQHRADGIAARARAHRGRPDRVAPVEKTAARPGAATTAPAPVPQSELVGGERRCSTPPCLDPPPVPVNSA